MRERLATIAALTIALLLLLAVATFAYMRAKGAP
jgi:hypothetical protein